MNEKKRWYQIDSPVDAAKVLVLLIVALCLSPLAFLSFQFLVLYVTLFFSSKVALLSLSVLLFSGAVWGIILEVKKQKKRSLEPTSHEPKAIDLEQAPTNIQKENGDKKAADVIAMLWSNKTKMGYFLKSKLDSINASPTGTKTTNFLQEHVIHKPLIMSLAILALALVVYIVSAIGIAKILFFIITPVLLIYFFARLHRWAAKSSYTPPLKILLMGFLLLALIASGVILYQLYVSTSSYQFDRLFKKLAEILTGIAIMVVAVLLFLWALKRDSGVDYLALRRFPPLTRRNQLLGFPITLGILGNLLVAIELLFGHGLIVYFTSLLFACYSFRKIFQFKGVLSREVAGEHDSLLMAYTTFCFISAIYGVFAFGLVGACLFLPCGLA